MRADFYHTLYALAGLSATQHHYAYDTNVNSDNDPAFKWKIIDLPEGDKGDRVAMIHPIFVLPWGDAERMKQWFVKSESD